MLLDRPELILGVNNAMEMERLAMLMEFDHLRSGSHTALPVAIMKCRRHEAALMLLETGCQPNLDNVRLAILRVHHLQSVLYHAATNPSSLKKQTRKVIWRQRRLSSGGRNIQPRIMSLKHEIPNSLLNYLLFIDVIL